MVGPYIYKGDQWFGYDDEKSFEAKANYIQAKGLAGAMVWSIDTDDFKGFCGKENGLINTLADVSKLRDCGNKFFFSFVCVVSRIKIWGPN